MARQHTYGGVKPAGDVTRTRLGSLFFRYTWPGRIIELAGGAAIVIKLAELIRDWEPDEYPQVVDTTGTRHPA